MAPELFKEERGQWFFVAFWHQDETLSDSKKFGAGEAASESQAGRNAHVAQMVERVLGKDEVISSILIMGSRSTLNKLQTLHG